MQLCGMKSAVKYGRRIAGVNIWSIFSDYLRSIRNSFSNSLSLMCLQTPVKQPRLDRLMWRLFLLHQRYEALATVKMVEKTLEKVIKSSLQVAWCSLIEPPSKCAALMTGSTRMTRSTCKILKIYAPDIVSVMFAHRRWRFPEVGWSPAQTIWNWA